MPAEPHEDGEGALYGVFFCPWCGKQLRPTPGQPAKAPPDSALRQIAAFIRHVVNPDNAQMSGATLTSLAKCADELDDLAILVAATEQSHDLAIRETVEVLERARRVPAEVEAAAREALALDEKATPGPWDVWRSDGSFVFQGTFDPAREREHAHRYQEAAANGVAQLNDERRRENARLIARSRTLLPLLARHARATPGPAIEGVRVEGVVEKRVRENSRLFREALPELLKGPLRGRWVVFLDGAVQCDFDDLDAANAEAIRRYGLDGGFAINQVVEGGAWGGVEIPTRMATCVEGVVSSDSHFKGGRRLVRIYCEQWPGAHIGQRVLVTVTPVGRR